VSGQRKRIAEREKVGEEEESVKANGSSHYY
jgi:hypothetical protein